MTPRRSPAVTTLKAAAVPVAEQIIYGLRVGDVFKLALTAKHAAELADADEREIWAAVKRGELRNSGHGRRIRITGQDLLTYLGLLPDTDDRKTA